MQKADLAVCRPWRPAAGCLSGALNALILAVFRRCGVSSQPRRYLWAIDTPKV